MEIPRPAVDPMIPEPEEEALEIERDPIQEVIDEYIEKGFNPNHPEHVIIPPPIDPVTKEPEPGYKKHPLDELTRCEARQILFDREVTAIVKA